MDDIYNRPDTKTVNINNVFQVKNDLSHIGYCQHLHGKAESEQDYKKENAYSNEQRKRIV